MSVDITIGDWSGNYTHNVSKLWHEHLLDDDSDKTGWDVIAGKSGKDAFHMLRDAFTLIGATRPSIGSTATLASLRSVPATMPRMAGAPQSAA